LRSSAAAGAIESNATVGKTVDRDACEYEYRLAPAYEHEKTKDRIAKLRATWTTAEECNIHDTLRKSIRSATAVR